MTEAEMERVDAGIAWLDEERPDWRERVNLADLDMRSANCCILGQVFEDDERASSPFSSGYVTGLVIAVGRGSVYDDVASEWSTGHGFNADDDDDGEAFAALDRAWRDRLSQ